MQATIDALCAGTAECADVYAALGCEVRPHGRWSGGKAVRWPGDESFHSMGYVTGNVTDALYLFDFKRVEEAMRAALALNREFVGRGGHDVLARRLCVVALTRPDLRRRR